jgi:hypothetical protein
MKITLSKRVLSVILTIVLILSIANSYVIFSMQSDRKTDDSIFNYVVFPDAGTYKAKNQASGLVDFSSFDASSVINQALDKGNYVYIKSGAYQLTSNVQILNKIKARLISDGATIIGNGYDITIKGDNYTTSQYNEISGFTVVNGTLRVENSFATTISDMAFENCTSALEFANTDTWTEGTKIDNIHFANCNESISFRTPNGANATGSYASTEITRCFFNQQDNSIGIHVEKAAEFSDSQLLNSRFWLGGEGETNQTGLFVDGAMFQTLLSSVVFESFANTTNAMYAISLGQNADPAPILDDGVSFLGNWTARVYNPFNVWVSGTGSVFRRTENVAVGTGNTFGETVNIHDRPLTISSFNLRIQVQSLADDETVTVRVRLEFVDNVISQSVVKSFTNATSVWLTDDDLLRLYPSQDIIWAILIDAKTNEASTRASVSVDIYGMTT